VEQVRWSAATAPEGQRAIPLPAGWIVEPSGPTPCAGLPQATAVVAAIPLRDFTVTLRAAVWIANDLSAEEGALACSSRRGTLGAASYASGADWLGVSYRIEGAFARVGPRQLMQLEVLSPDQKSVFARNLLAAWLKKATE
jgi:hypothetical protein